jgi:hypothetical protein
MNQFSDLNVGIEIGLLMIHTPAARKLGRRRRNEMDKRRLATKQSKVRQETHRSC